MEAISIDAELAFKYDAELGEGPVWDEIEGKLYWVDILSGRLLVYDNLKKSIFTFDIGEDLGAVALRKQEGLVMALKTGFAFFDIEAHKITRITDPEEALSGNRFNDGKCDPSGRFWAGTLSYDLEKGAGRLYCLNHNLSVEVKLKEVTISNGMAWNINKNKFYFIDSAVRKIFSFDYKDKLCEISNKKVVRKFAHFEGSPDGMTIDKEGCLWIALYGGKKVIRINPINGKTLLEVHLPVSKITSCTFGGHELDELYITTARENMSKKELAKEPLSGSLFKVKVPFQGIPAFRFSG